MSIYCGPADSDRARLWMSIDMLDRERREQEAMERAIARNQFAELTSTPEAETEVLAEARRATVEALTAAGYHQHHRGEWRKRRGYKNEDQDEGASA